MYLQGDTFHMEAIDMDSIISMFNNKKKRKKEKEAPVYIDLPPRVSIDILSFCIFDLKPSDCRKPVTIGDEFISVEKPLSLFGYFGKDRLRNIWLMFSSLRISYSTNVLVKFQKLRHLELKNIEPIVFDTILKNPHMPLLTSLEIDVKKEYSAVVSSKFIDPLMLSAGKDKGLLKSLKLLYIGDYVGTGSVWNSCIFKNLSRISIFVKRNSDIRLMPVFSNPSLFRENSFRNIREIFLCDIHCEEEYVMSIPSCEYLRLIRCSNLKVRDGNKIRFLTVENIPATTLKELYESCRNLEMLRLQEFSSNDPCNWFLNYFENPLEKIKVITIVNFSRFDGTSKHIQLNECKNLVFLSIFKCSEFVENLFFKEVKSLNILCFSGNENLAYTKTNEWKILRGISNLKITDSDMLDDNLFSDHEFVNLRKLELNRISVLSGSNWSDLSLVEDITFANLVNFSDVYFNTQKSFIGLQCLRLQFLDNLIGVDWGIKKFENLKNLRIDGCQNLEDVIFSENEYPKLERLWIYECPNIHGHGWKKLESLEYLTIRCCDNFNDEFFQQHESKMLLEISVTGDMKCEGKNWKFMKKLRFLTCSRSSVGFYEKIMENKPFPESTKVNRIQSINGITQHFQ